MLEMEQQPPASMSLPKQEKLEIDTLIPDISLLLRLDTAERGSQSVTAQIKKTVEELSKEHTEKALNEYLKDNGEFAEKETYSDAYYYKLSQYYRLLGKYDKERNALMQIRDTENPFYRQEILKNRLICSQPQNTKETEDELIALQSTDSMCSVVTMLFAKKEYCKANQLIKEYLEKSDEDREITGTLLCQYALSFVFLNDYHSAIHFFRTLFYVIEERWDVALFLAYLYRELGKKHKKLLAKALWWLKYALALNPTSKAAVALFCDIGLEEETDFFTGFMEKFVDFPSTKAERHFYCDAVNILANCYFIQGKYGKALQTLQEIAGDDYFYSGIRYNIALCNRNMGNIDRAYKNIEVAYRRLRDGDPRFVRQGVTGFYLSILFTQKKYDEVKELFEKEFTWEYIPGTRKEYLRSCDHYVSALWNHALFDRYRSYCEYMYDRVEGEVKMCFINALIRYRSYIEFSSEKLTAYAHLLEKEFIKEYKKTRKIPGYFNNVIFALVECNIKPKDALMKLFIPNVTKNPYFCATFGLYQARIHNNAEKCEKYYTKAISLITENYGGTDEQLVLALKIKRDGELYRLYELQGRIREAQRIKERIEKKYPKELLYYKNIFSK